MFCFLGVFDDWFSGDFQLNRKSRCVLSQAKLINKCAIKFMPIEIYLELEMTQ